eukprot:NODE_1911_length_1358_cov_33.472116_g1730_i0.p1 GENE.NODE_1911_length_1358_cov_33.472116_g1730_i0~~NODE_1911_length_1358_cov_33.472116_g1730_i0.p1  ORF type:complete len:371 (+),score=59.11 NODE_1911_length_1358_cov_33.472116_g1730_i0:114-1226(+)
MNYRNAAFPLRGLGLAWRLITSSSRPPYVWDCLANGAMATTGNDPRLQEGVYEWSRANPMLLDVDAEPAVLRIGERFQTRLDTTPQVTDSEWAMLSLPTNKSVLYKTLKAFSLNHHVLYVGETGSGKTWLARAVARVLGLKLWTVSLTEFTKNEDLVVRTTFGEEGSNRTGLSKCTVLEWMEEGGLLLLDELHKPIDGLSVLNNILQYGEFVLPDGRSCRLDPSRSKVIATMNPVRPPYRGEVPSAELAARFGGILDVNWLTEPEEVALLTQVAPRGTDSATLLQLVRFANATRSQYPAAIPLPFSTRTLINIVQHCYAFPEDPIREIITTAFNPCAIVDDPSVRKALDVVLTAHGFDAHSTVRSLASKK